MTIVIQPKCPCADPNCSGKTGVLHPRIQQIVNGLTQGGVDSVTSGLRCPAHNKAVGGEPNSSHLRGTALDIVPHDSRASLIDYLWDKGNVRIITYETDKHVHVHLDEETSIWVKTKEGRYVEAV